MARSTAAVHFPKEQTFPNLGPTLFPFRFQFLLLFPSNLSAPPPLLATLDYLDSLPGLSLHLEHSLGSSRWAQRNQISQELKLIPQWLLRLTHFPSISLERFSHELHSSLQNNTSIIILHIYRIFTGNKENRNEEHRHGLQKAT